MYRVHVDNSYMYIKESYKNYMYSIMRASESESESYKSDRTPTPADIIFIQ